MYDIIGTSGFVPNIIATILILVQALFINKLVNDNSMARENTFLPAIGFLLVASAFPEFHALSPLLMANTFFIIALSELFDTYRKYDVSGNVFNVGFWIAIASLFHFSMGIYFFLGVIGLAVLRAFNVGELLVMLIGYCIPYFLYGVYRFWFDGFGSFWQDQIVNNLSFIDFNINWYWATVLQIVFLAAILIWSIVNVQAYLQRANIDAQKKITLLFWLILVAGFSLIYQSNISLEHFFMIVIPLGVFISFNLMILKNTAVADFLHILLFVLVLTLQYQTMIF